MNPKVGMPTSRDLKSITVNIDAALFARASACVSADETRYYLSGVHVEACDAGGVIMVSTDGHSLIAIRDASGSIENGPAIISPSRPVLTACRRSDEVKKRRILVAGGRLSLVAEPPKEKPLLGFVVCEAPDATVIAFQWRDVLIDGTFPNWRRVLPKVAPNASKPRSSVNPALVLKIAASLSIGKGAGAVVCGDAGEENPAWVFCPNSQHHIDGFGIVMPMRLVEVSAPSWISIDASVGKAA